MEDWKERFKKEYYEKGTLEFKPNCPIDLLKSQASIMYSYLWILQERAKIEGIQL